MTDVDRETALTGPCPTEPGELRGDLACLACGDALAACPLLREAAERRHRLGSASSALAIPSGWGELVRTG